MLVAVGSEDTASDTSVDDGDVCDQYVEADTNGSNTEELGAVLSVVVQATKGDTSNEIYGNALELAHADTVGDCTSAVARVSKFAHITTSLSSSGVNGFAGGEDAQAKDTFHDFTEDAGVVYHHAIQDTRCTTGRDGDAEEHADVARIWPTSAGLGDVFQFAVVVSVM